MAIEFLDEAPVDVPPMEPKKGTIEFLDEKKPTVQFLDESSGPSVQFMDEPEPSSRGEQIKEIPRSMLYGATDAYLGVVEGAERGFEQVSRKLETSTRNRYDELINRGEDPEGWKAGAYNSLANMHKGAADWWGGATGADLTASRRQWVDENIAPITQGFVTDVARGLGGMATLPLDVSGAGVLTIPGQMFDEGYQQSTGTEEERLDKATAYAFLASPVELAGDIMLKKFGGRATKTGLTAIAKQAFKKLGLNFVSEGSTETLQDGILNKINGKRMFDENSMRTFLVSGTVGTIVSGAHVVNNEVKSSRTRGQLETMGLNEAEITTTMELIGKGRVDEATAFIANNKRLKMTDVIEASQQAVSENTPIDEKQAAKLESLVGKDVLTDQEQSELADLQMTLDQDDQTIIDNAINRVEGSDVVFNELIQRLKQETQNGSERKQTIGTEQETVTGQEPVTADQTEQGATVQDAGTAEKGKVAPEVRAFAERIARGDSMASVEDRQFYQNNSKVIEAELQRMQQDQEQKSADQTPVDENTPAGRNNAAMNAEREAMDKAQLPEAERESQEIWMNEAVEQGLIEEAETTAQDIINASETESPIGITVLETKANELRRQQVKTERRKLYREKNAAQEAGNQELADDISQQISDLVEVDAMLQLGSTLGARINAKAQAARVQKDGFSYEKVDLVDQARERNGAPLEPEVQKSIEDDADAIEVAQNELDDAVDNAQKQNAKESIEDLKNNIEFMMRNIEDRAKKGKKRKKDVSLAARLKGIIRSQDNLFDLAKKINKTRNITNDNFVAMLKNLPAEIRESAWYKELKRDADRQPNKARQLETLERRLEKLTKQYEDGFINVPKSEQVVDDADIKELKDSIAEVKSLINVEGQIAKYDEMLRTGDFKTEEKKVTRKQSQEILDLKAHLNLLKKEVDHKIYKLKPKKLRDYIREILSIPRTLMATGDISGALRQGMLGLFMNPKQYSKSFGKALAATFSSKNASQYQIEMQEHPMFEETVKYGVDYSDQSGAIGNKEESFASSFAEKIPIFGSVVKASERNMVTFLNLLRFGTMSDYLMKHPEHSEKSKKAFAQMVNAGTGRGTGRVLDSIGPELSGIFFAPRFAWSRIQAPMLAAQNITNPELRGEIVKQWGGMFATGMTILALAKSMGAEVEEDPKDSDWGKIVIDGNKHIDIWGGLQQPMRILAKAIKGGAEYAMEGETDADPIDDIARFLRYKLSPPLTMLQELGTGRDVIGRETEEEFAGVDMPKAATVLIKNMTPLVLQSAVEAVEEGESLTMAGVLAAGEGLGLSIGVYDK